MATILALDAGTTGVTALVFTDAQTVAGRGYQEFPQHFPQPGWVEHDLDDIWDATRTAWSQALRDAGIGPTDVDAIGITNQRETTGVWDRSTSKPIHRAIVWQDRRTAPRIEELKRLRKSITAKTGLVPDAYFSATKLEWLLLHVDGAADRAAAGELAFGTIDTWLLWKLTDGASHGTDVTNASRTMMWDIHTGHWDSDLLGVFGVPDQLLPQVLPSGAEHGTADAGVFGAEVPILAIAGDQQAALFGQGCTEPGEAKCTYGTGCFLLQHTGDEPAKSKRGLLTTRAVQFDATPQFALEGAVFVGGAAVQWFRDGLQHIRVASEIDKLAMQVDGPEGAVVVPAFTGLGAPHWDPDARGAVFGITRGTTDRHLAYATLQGIAHQVADLVDAMEKESRRKVKALRVDGGATKSDPLMQIQADLLRVKVERPPNVEATARGAAWIAGITGGHWVQTVATVGKPEHTYKPQQKRGAAKDERKRWAKAVKACRQFGS